MQPCPNTCTEHLHYPDMVPVSRHPSPDEINTYYSWYEEQANKEQLEVLQSLRDHQIVQSFKAYAKPVNTEDAIEKAIKWWMDLYPWEVKEFFFYIDYQKQRLANAKGFSTDKSKIHMYEGAIPRTIKHLLTALDPNFFKQDPNGKTPGYTKFYKIFQKARIGGSN